MAEFMEVAREKKRMCNVYHKRDCCGCPLNEAEANCGVFCVRYVEDDDIKRVEETVMTWAKEHPKPVYPTWGEYLASIGVMKPAKPDEVYGVWFFQLYSTNIPDDIAEKLGLEPKER